jgi:hypothetical protein
MKKIILNLFIPITLFASGSTALEVLQKKLTPLLSEGTFFSTIQPSFLDNKALLIRTYPTQKAFLSLGSEDAYAIIYEGKPKAKEILVAYDQATDNYLIFYHYYKRKLRDTSYPTEVIPFAVNSVSYLSNMFQSIVVNHPMILVTLKYLQKQGNTSNMQLNHYFNDIHKNLVSYDQEGRIQTSLVMRPQQKSPLKEEYYITTKEGAQSYRYYSSEKGVNRVSEKNRDQKTFIPEHTMLNLLNKIDKKSITNIPTF